MRRRPGSFAKLHMWETPQPVPRIRPACGVPMCGAASTGRTRGRLSGGLGSGGGVVHGSVADGHDPLLARAARSILVDMRPGGRPSLGGRAQAEPTAALRPQSSRRHCDCVRGGLGLPPFFCGGVPVHPLSEGLTDWRGIFAADVGAWAQSHALLVRSNSAKVSSTHSRPCAAEQASYSLHEACWRRIGCANVSTRL